MLIIGCDFHTRYQQIAMMDEATGELTERRLDHESGDGTRVEKSSGRVAWPLNFRVAHPLAAAADKGCGFRLEAISPSALRGKPGQDGASSDNLSVMGRLARNAAG